MSTSRSAVTKAEAYVVSGIGGGIDAIGVLTLSGLFVAHMSGNTASLGALIGQGNWAAGAPHLYAIPVFVLGLFLGYFWAGHSGSQRRCAGIFLTEAILLVVFGMGLGLVGNPDPGHPVYFLIAAPVLLAMGLQNATLRRIGRTTFPATYVTGVLDQFAQSAADACAAPDHSTSKARWREARGALGIWGAYVLGALLGSFGLLVSGRAILLLPIIVLLILAARLAWTKGGVGDRK